MPRKKLPNKLMAPHIALISTALIWGIAGPVIKLTLPHIPVFTFLLYRFLLVGLFALPYLLLKLRDDPIDKRDLPNLIILGIASQVSIALIFLGLNFTTALDTAIISIISPILMFLAGRYFYNEKITKLEGLGVGLATMGTLFIVIEPALFMEGNGVVTKRIVGNLFVLLYQFSWPVYVILGKHMVGKDSRVVNRTFKYFHLRKLSKDYHPSTLTAFTFFVGLAFFTPAALIESTRPGFSVNFTPVATGGIVYMAILSSIVAYGLYQWGLKHLEIQETAVYGYLGAVFTIPAAYILLGEVPTTTMMIGAGVIALGVVIAEKFKS